MTRMFSAELIAPAIGSAFAKLSPPQLVRNPVLFVTAVVALLLTVLLMMGHASLATAFQVQLIVWLWLTVLFGTFAEALAEGRGRAQAVSLRAAKSDVKAKRLVAIGDAWELDGAAQLRRGERVLVAADDLIPADGEIVDGVASVNEAAITGESGPVIREAGGDRSAVTAGTRVISDQIVVRVTQEPGQGFLDRMIALVEGAEAVPLTAQTRTSGLRWSGGEVLKGAVDSILKTPTDAAGAAALRRITDEIARAGQTPLAVMRDGRLLGAVALKNTVKSGVRERFAELRRMGIRTVMITGDNPLTAAAIASEAGVDDVLAEATPEDKLDLIRREQAGGRLVAMCGDGTNDAPALAQADVGVAMNTGTQAAREAGNMVDLDSDPTKLIEVVGLGKQLLMTRGALTTFSVANDVAKYFAIIPAMFVALYPGLGALNVMRLSSPESAILSAIIFNALIIPALVPLALRGVTYKPMAAGPLLARNLAVYGLGGLIAPFVGIKAIDLAVAAFHLA